MACTMFRGDAWSRRVSLKCSKEHALDGSEALREKAARYRADNSAEMSPLTMYSGFVVDCLRATIICADSEAMVLACEALTRPKSSFTEVKFRNNLGALRRPFNLVFNAVFKPMFSPPLMVEITLVHHDVHLLVGMADRFEKISTVPDVEAICPRCAPTCEAVDEAKDGGRRAVTGARGANAGGFKPWSSYAGVSGGDAGGGNGNGSGRSSSMRFAGSGEADTTAEEDRLADDAALVRFVNAPDRPLFPQTGTAAAAAAAASKLGLGGGDMWGDPETMAAAAAAVKKNTTPFNQRQQQQRPQQLQLPANAAVAAAAAAARAALDDIDELSGVTWDSVKPDMSYFVNPAGEGGGPLIDPYKLSERELKAMIPPAYNYMNNSRFEVTGFDTSDSDADPGSPELRRQIPPPPIRKIDGFWGSGERD